MCGRFRGSSVAIEQSSLSRKIRVMLFRSRGSERFPATVFKNQPGSAYLVGLNTKKDWVLLAPWNLSFSFPGSCIAVCVKPRSVLVSPSPIDYWCPYRCESLSNVVLQDAEQK